jgi:hypothetical protein
MVGSSLPDVSKLPLSTVARPQALETGKSNSESSIPTNTILTKSNPPEMRNEPQDKSSDIADLPQVPLTHWAPNQRENLKRGPGPVIQDPSKAKQSKTSSQLTTSKQFSATTQVPVPASASGGSSLRPGRLPVSENRASTPFKLAVKTGVEFFPTNEESFSVDSVSQAHMAKTLGGLGRSKWA